MCNKSLISIKKYKNNKNKNHLGPIRRQTRRIGPISPLPPSCALHLALTRRLQPTEAERYFISIDNM